MKTLAIVIPSYNTEALLHACLAAICRTADMASTELIVVDNASADDSVAMVRRTFPAARVLAQTSNCGFGAACNLGVAAATAPYVMLLNSDTELLEDTGGTLVNYLMEHPDVSCVGPRIVLPDGAPQPRVYGHLPTLRRIAMQSLGPGRLCPGCAALAGTDGHRLAGAEAEVGWLSGVCMVLRRADFLAAGGFDPAIFMYCEDLDLCWRLAARGGRIVRLDRVPVLHHGGGSAPAVAAQLRNALWQQRNLLRIVRGRSGRAAAQAAALLLAVGLLLRVAAGLAMAPRQGVRANVLLRSSWLRLRDLAGLAPAGAGDVPG